jgi:glycolate oxidase iron-sulfur subunit
MSARDPIPTGGFVADAAFLDCVHCGLCHSACPTYVELGTEADSPRGRIHLMRALQEGTLPLDDEAVRHLDLCLGCRGCETACPSGVQYGVLIESVRPWIEARHRRPWSVRMWRRATLALLPHRGRMRAALAPLRLLERAGVLRAIRAWRARLPAAWRYAASLLPDRIPPAAHVPPTTAARGSERAHVELLIGCVMPELFGDTVRSTLEVLAANGCRISAPAGQGCCGALSLHAGDRAGAERFARANVDAFEGAADARPLEPRCGESAPEPTARPLVVNASGCGAIMKEYGALLGDDPAYAARAARLAARVRDATELLASLPMIPPTRAAAPRRIAYHDPCHLAHAQGIREAPRALLAALPGVTLVPMADEDLCCGSAGHYNVMQPDVARRLVARKVEAMAESGAQLIATANAGCALQLEAGLRAAGNPLGVRHVLDVLAEAYRDRE